MGNGSTPVLGQLVVIILTDVRYYFFMLVVTVVTELPKCHVYQIHFRQWTVSNNIHMSPYMSS